jgi:hypothetical protein
MADPDQSASAEAVEEARNAAAGTRATSRLIASAFAGIPALSVIGALVRAPGDAGFDWLNLSLGVALAALGAVIGIYSFATVQEPASLTDADIPPDIVKRMPEARVTSFGALRQAVEQTRSAVGVRRYQASDASAYSAAADARADAADATVKSLEQSVAASTPPAQALVDELAAARAQARALRSTAVEKTVAKELATRELQLATDNLTLLESLRRAAYGLRASDRVNERFTEAKQAGILAVAFVAAGVVLLAQAPKTTSPPVPQLVTLKLNAAGKTALKCSAPTVQAIRVGGDDDTPTVITLPSGACPTAVSARFATAAPKPLGTVAEETPVEVR